MARTRGQPFQVLMTLRVAAIVLLLTATFLWIVLGRVQRQVEASGRENFSLLARGAFSELDLISQSFVAYLDTLQKLAPALPDLRSEPAVKAIAQSLLRQQALNAVSVTWPNDELLFIIKVYPEAPRETAYTVGHVMDIPDGTRRLNTRFYTADDRLISQTHRSVAFGRIHEPWYRGVMQEGRFVSRVHRFPGEELGFAMAARAPGAVVSLTSSLRLLDRLLDRIPLTPNGAALLIDDEQRVIALRTRGAGWGPAARPINRLRQVDALDNAVLSAAAAAATQLPVSKAGWLPLAGQPYLVAWHPMMQMPGAQYRLLLLAPLDDMAEVAARARRDAWLVALAGLALLLPLTWFGTGAFAEVLQRLVENSRRIGELDFAPVAHRRPSGVREVQELECAHDAMRHSLATRTRNLELTSRDLRRLIEVGVQLAGEPDRKAMLDALLAAAHEITGAQTSLLDVRDADDCLRAVAAVGFVGTQDIPVLDLKRPELGRISLVAHTALAGTTIVVDDLPSDPREELTTWRIYGKDYGIDARSIVSVPLRTLDHRVLGVMEIVNATDPLTGAVVPFTKAQVTYLEALAGHAAVALEHQELLASQRRMLDTLVRMLGDAIDAKSPYTGRHCARVPELAFMLAREADAARDGPLADFHFRDDDAWREFRIGAWLHDCGKIASPEHVIDKATRLEMVYNRIHEVRMRFEVLLRDARIETLQARLAGRLDEQAGAAADARCAQALQQDFAFIAACNLGGESTAATDIARIRAIARRTWVRHFDDRLGLSQAEQAQHGDSAAPELPAPETLLADKPWHIVPRAQDEQRQLTEGFRMAVPEHLYHHGELHNLCLERGTLTPEERFKVNEHIIHTIRMLESAQFPPNLRRVPEYAGTHHETLDGKGYPRGLTAAELSIPARIMAIADIFEALTAADRPYKRAKTLSESIAILHRLKCQGKIDADLFALFLRRGIHLRYAERFLTPEQIDVVDIAPYLE